VEFVAQLVDVVQQLLHAVERRTGLQELLRLGRRVDVLAQAIEYALDVAASAREDMEAITAREAEVIRAHLLCHADQRRRAGAQVGPLLELDATVLDHVRPLLDGVHGGVQARREQVALPDRRVQARVGLDQVSRLHPLIAQRTQALGDLMHGAGGVESCAARSWRGCSPAGWRTPARAAAGRGCSAA